MSDLNIFNDVIQLVWPMLAVFGLIVSLRAKQRHPGQGSTLMVAGSTISMLVSAFYLLRNFGMQYDWFNYDDFTMLFTFSSIASILGQVLFLVGLLTLINSIITVEEKPMDKY